MRYNSYSEHLKLRYGSKVYKIPVNLPLTCPNRDGNLSCGGCAFCSEDGAAFENISSSTPIKDQIKENIRVIGEKYGADKFIIYFQNFTNTYMPLGEFKAMINEACYDGVCAVYVSTRPDCIREDYMEFLAEFSKKTGYDICIELGLQTVNYKTLARINRGHSLAEFIDAVLTVKKFGFDICAHIILNLPWDTIDDCVECAKFLSALKVDQVKLHSLYIPKGTPIADMFENGEFSMGTMYDYVERVVTFLEYLSPKIVIQRLIGRAKEDHTLFCNYGVSWWKIKDNIDSELELRDIHQGNKCTYLSGKALRRFE